MHDRGGPLPPWQGRRHAPSAPRANSIRANLAIFSLCPATREGKTMFGNNVANWETVRLGTLRVLSRRGAENKNQNYLYRANLTRLDRVSPSIA